MSAQPRYLIADQVVEQVRSRKIWELLGYLALTGVKVERSAAALAIWDGEPLGRALQNLRQTLLYIRQQFPSAAHWLEVSRTTLSIRLDKIEIEIEMETFLSRYTGTWGRQFINETAPVSDIEDDFLFVPFKRLDRETRRSALLGMSPAMINLGQFRQGLEEIQNLRQHPTYANDFALAACEAEILTFGKKIPEARGILAEFWNHPESQKPKNFGRLRVLDSACTYAEGNFQKSRSEALEVARLNSNLGISRQVGRSMHIAIGASFFLKDTETANSLLQKALKFSASELEGPWHLIFRFLDVYFKVDSGEEEGLSEQLDNLKDRFWSDTQNGINAVFLARLGYLYQKQDYSNKAELLYVEGLRRLSATDCHHETAEVHSYLGDLYGSRKQFDESMNAHLSAVKLRRPLGSPIGLGTSLRGAGVAATELGLLSKAFQYFDEAAKIFSDIRNPFGVASSNIGLARVLYKMGRNEEAVNLFSASIAEMEFAYKKTPQMIRPTEFASIEVLQSELSKMSPSCKN